LAFGFDDCVFDPLNFQTRWGLASGFLGQGMFPVSGGLHAVISNVGNAVLCIF